MLIFFSFLTEQVQIKLRKGLVCVCLTFEYVTELELSLALRLRNALNTSAFDLLSSSADLSAGTL